MIEVIVFIAITFFGLVAIIWLPFYTGKLVQYIGKLIQMYFPPPTCNGDAVPSIWDGNVPHSLENSFMWIWTSGLVCLLVGTVGVYVLVSMNLGLLKMIL